MCLHHPTHGNQQDITTNTRGRRIDKFYQSTYFLYGLAICVAFIGSWTQIESLRGVAQFVSEVFMRLLKVVSLPLLFLSVITAFKEISTYSSVSILLKRLVGYTFLTTYLAALVGLLLFLYIDPTHSIQLCHHTDTKSIVVEHSNPARGYVAHFMSLLPSNAISPFLEGNVIGILLLASLVACASIQLKANEKEVLFNLFTALYSLFMVIIGWIIRWIPLALWSFLTLFLLDIHNGSNSHLESLGRYLCVIFAANTIQGFIVLPLLLLLKKISPFSLCKAMMPALGVAFFTKSSSATVPTAIQAAVQRAHISEHIARTSFPLCTTINMNGCAAFILVTSLFVMKAHGIEIEVSDMFIWTIIAVIAAVGNAGVPMGCYFLTSALLASMNIPLTIMGLILPFYAMIDAYETAINIWSDSCVAKMVDSDCLLDVKKCK